MGTLIAMAYPTKMFLKQADHTYVKCSTGKRAWGCWGGKKGGKELRRAMGSTKRADKIAQPDERANIKCYLINGVCHQAANRVLLPAGILVRGARGYSISESLFGPYGRPSGPFRTCKSPFMRYKNVTGDLQECVVTLRAAPKSAIRPRPALTDRDKLDWHYIKGASDIYSKAQPMMKSNVIDSSDAMDFQIELFMYMAEFHLGPMLGKNLSRNLQQVRHDIEKIREKHETLFANKEMDIQEFVDAFDDVTIKFQNEMANIMKPEQYETLFDLKPGDHVVLADRRIVKKIFIAK